MGKIKKLFKGISILIQKPYMINKVIDNEDIHESAVKDQNASLTNGLPIIDLTDLLPNFNETIDPYSFLKGGSLITDLALLKGLAKKQAQCCYFEIGTWRGESVSNVSKVASTCYTLNLTNNALKELGCNDEYISQQEFFSKNLKNITHLKGNSFNFDFTPYYKKCDVVFIDGDHHYKSVLNDTKIAFKLLKNESSVIVWHDYTNHEGEIRWDVLRGIYEGTPKEKRAKLFSVSNTLSVIFTNYSTKIIAPNGITPTKKFSINISAKKLL